MKLLALLISGMSLVVSCSHKREEFIAHPREPEFYNRFVNSSAEITSAPEKISQMKLLMTPAQYPLRFALYDNGKFYYEVDKLGSGFGRWNYTDGALELVAERVLFDMYLYVSAQEKEGTEVLVRFADRHGQNSIPLKLRDPKALEASGTVVQELPVFTASPKNI